jgi:16S rRNA (cytosine1402-N4)-methyltransferase
LNLTHTTVLLSEAVDALRPASSASSQIYLDGTYGRGGHSRLLLSRMGPQDRLIAFDKDQAALADAARVQDPRFAMVHSSFAGMAVALERAGVQRGQVHGVLLDLGISSPQVDDAERGFSFRFDAPLDMRMDQSRGTSAADFLAVATAHDIARVLRDYGEERFAGPLARAIVELRESGRPVRRTSELAALCERVIRRREPGQHPATRSFQALRIEVNHELDDLQAGLEAALAWLAPQGRLVVISFHSLEDRMVKRFIARHARHEVDRRAPFAEPLPLMLREVARVRPGEAEVAANPRSRSAVMRVAERTAVPWPDAGQVEGRR